MMRLLLAFVLAIAGVTPAAANMALRPAGAVVATGSGEEFVGPFANWTNVKTSCGAVGNGSTNDAGAFQTCFNGLSSTAPVIWVPASTYAISDVTPTATVAAGNNNMTLSSASGVVVGMAVTGAGVPAADSIVSLSGTSAILRYAANSALSNTTVKFTPSIATSGYIRTTATAANGTNVIAVASASGFSTGYNVAGDGIPTDITNPCHVANISGTNITLLKSDNSACNTTGTLSTTPVAFFVSGQQYVSLIGEDPATTILRWMGSSGGAILSLNGVTLSRFNRLTFDGQNTAGVAVDQSWSNVTTYFDSGNEYADDVFENAVTGWQCGNFGFGCSESVFIRSNFINNSFAGMATKNYNALNEVCWFCSFTNNGIGITNITGGSAGAYRSAGNFHSYGSYFNNPGGTDISIGNTGGFDFRWNYSTGSGQFLFAANSNNPAFITLQGNTVVDTTANSGNDSVYNGNLGPLFLLDNIFASEASTTTGKAVHAAGYGAPSGVFSMGNTYTLPLPGAVATDFGGNFHSITTGADPDISVSRNSLSPVPPALPPVPSNHHRTIYEATSLTTINSGIASAGATCDNSVVHIQPGTIPVTSTIVVPANCYMQIIGDGFSSQLNAAGTNPVLQLNGPSKVTLRDFDCEGNAGAADCIIVGTADQAGSRVFMMQVSTSLNSTNNLFVDALDNTGVEVQMSFSSYDGLSTSTAPPSTKVTGGPQAAMGNWLGGVTKLISGSSAGNYVDFSVTGGAHLVIEDIWKDSNADNFGWDGNQHQLTASGASVVTYAGSAINVLSLNTTVMNLAGFTGTAAFVNIGMNNISSNVVVTSGTGANVLGLGLSGQSSTFFSGDSATTEFLLSSLAGIAGCSACSISGTILTVGGWAINTGQGAWAPGQTIFGSGVTGSPVITAFGSGAGGNGTYTITNPNGITLSAQAMTAGPAGGLPTMQLAEVPGTPVASFLNTTLAQMMVTKPTGVLNGLPAGVTDVRMYRVRTENGAIGVHLRAN